MIALLVDELLDMVDGIYRYPILSNVCVYIRPFIGGEEQYIQ